MVQFTFCDFKKYLDLKDGINPISLNEEKLLGYNCTQFVLPISKSFVELSMPILPISQVKFDIRLLHWILVKILYRKSKNLSRDDDSDLQLIWCLIDKGIERVRLIINRMIHCRDNPTKPLFFSSFVQMILELNGIKSKEGDLMGDLVCMDESMWYPKCDTTETQMAFTST